MHSRLMICFNSTSPTLGPCLRWQVKRSKVFRRLRNLNLQVGRSVLAESVTRFQEMKPDTIHTDGLASPSRFAQSAGEKALSYQRHVGDIAAATQSGLAKIAEAHYEQFTRDAQTRIDNWVEHAPAGSTQPQLR